MRYKLLIIFVLALFICLFLRIAENRAEENDKLKLERIILTFNKELSRQKIKLLAKIIKEESDRYNFSPILITSIIGTESSFKIKSRSRKGCLGLMQIKLTTAREVAKKLKIKWQGRRTLYEPEKNIKIGVFYLRKMRNRFENLETALIAYNSGPTITQKRLRLKRRLCQRYPQRVMNYCKKFSPAGF